MTFPALVSLWKRTWRSAMLMGVFGTGIRVGANLLLLPLLLKLSRPELAMWWVFAALGNFGNLADFGFGSTIPRIYSYLMAGAEDFDAEGLREAKTGGSPNFAGIRRLNATVRSLYLKISLAAIGLLVIGGTIYLMKLSSESDFTDKFWCLWAVFVVAIGYNLATYHWVLAVQGLNRMRELQVAYVWGGLSYVACAGIMLVFHMGLASMVIATFMKGIILHGRCRQIFRQIIPDQGQPATPDRHIVKKLWPNTYKFGLIALGGYCMGNVNVLICRRLLGDDMTASYGLTAQVGNYLNGFADLWLGVKWPQISILRTQKRLVEMAVLFARRLALVMLSYVGLSLMVFFAGNALLAWRATPTRLLSAPYLAFYLLYLTHGIFCMELGMLAFTENVVPLFKGYFFTGIIVVVSSLILTRSFGLWGMLAAPFMANTVYGGLMARRGFQGQPLSPRQFVLAALRGHV